MIFTKTIYCIRHGETIANKNHERQGEGGGLTEDGKYQAFIFGENIERFKIKKIICSPFQRAIETLNEIQKTLHIPEDKIIYTPLIGERRNPSKIISKKYEDPIVIEAIDFMDKTLHEEDARWEDEENFVDLKLRAEKAIKFIEKTSEDKTLIVSHGIFLKMMICSIYYRHNLDIKHYINFNFLNSYDNTALTILKYHPWKIFSKNKWDIVVFNDTTLLESSKTNNHKIEQHKNSI